MLHTLGLKQGQWEPINGEARHINIVLAAGEIDVRVKKRGSSAYSTQMVGGMALELPVFDSVEIRSDTDQIIKVWVSELPLNYSPDTARQVGSNALRSSVGQVFSGFANEILPAEVGRNKITLTPEREILIGGANLNAINGVKVRAGEPFPMATQGAVYAMELSGDYPASYTASMKATDVENPTTITTAESAVSEPTSRHFIGRPESGELLVFKNGTLNRISADLKTVLGGVTINGKEQGNIAQIDHKGRYSAPLTYASAYSKHWATIDPDTLEISYEEMTQVRGQSSSSAISEDGALRAEYQQTAGLQISENGAPFAYSGVVVPDEGYITYGLAITSDKAIWLLTTNFLYKTTDKGATWEAFSTPVSITAGSLAATGDDTLLVMSGDQKTVWEFTGAAFVPYLTGAFNFSLMHSLGGRVLLASTREIFFVENGEVFKFDKGFESYCRSMNITTIGKAYVRYDDVSYIIEGERALAGGLSVAIMSEVN